MLFNRFQNKRGSHFDLYICMFVRAFSLTDFDAVVSIVFFKKEKVLEILYQLPPKISSVQKIYNFSQDSSSKRRFIQFIYKTTRP